MSATVLIIPGLNDSGPTHWQTWLQDELPGCRRVTGINWQEPVISLWSSRIGKAIDEIDGRVCLAAHSYGCLGTVIAAASRLEKIASALLVAPADPDLFSPFGFRDKTANGPYSLTGLLPSAPLGFPSIVVASDNDPWMKAEVAASWAGHWKSLLVTLNGAGHINIDSGFGPWPEGLNLLRLLQAGC